MSSLGKRFVALLFVCVAGGTMASAQISDARKDELRKKYTWGSIYLTYGPICDITQLLAQPETLKKISADPSTAVASIVSTFLQRNRAANWRDGIAFIEINLNTQEAGYMKAADLNGVINRIPWNPGEVLQAADLFDRFLTDYSSFTATYSKLISGYTHLVEAWDLVQEARATGDYLPTEKFAFLDISFRVLTESKETELAGLKNSNADLYSSISHFIVRFDKSFKNIVSPRDPKRYARRLLWRSDRLEPDVLQPVTNPYMDPTKAWLLKGDAKLGPRPPQ